MKRSAAQQPGVALVVQATRAALAAELRGESAPAAVTTPGAAALLRAGLVDALIEHRVLPLLAPVAAPLGFDEETVDLLQGLHREQRLAAMAVLAMTARVSAALARAGLPHLMVKGPALATQTTGDPLARGAGDVDVLLAPADAHAAVEALAAAGIEAMPVGAPAPGAPTFPAVQRSQKELTLLGQGVEIDLHWRLDHVRSCLTWPFDDLLAAAETLTLGGVQVQTLSRRHAAIVNASQAGSDAWSHLRAFVDQARLQADQDLDALRAEAHRVGAGRRWDLAQVMLARLLGQPSPPVPRSVEATGDRLWRWLLAGQGPRERVDARASVRGLGASLLTLDSPRAGAQRLETVLWPVGAMADRALGGVGDRHPWLYPLATPYFLPTRLLARWRVGAR